MRPGENPNARGARKGKNDKRPDDRTLPQKPVTVVSSKQLYKYLNKTQAIGTKLSKDISRNPIDKGYGVKVPTRPMSQANCRLTQLRGNKKERIHLYITGFETGFEMAGESAQSRDTQQFFPSNFVQPVITLTGIAPSDYEYNRIGKYVRESHLHSVHGPEGQWVYLMLSNRSNGFPIKGDFPYDGSPDRAKTNRQTTKGRHRSWMLYGYIRSMTAGSKPSPQGQGGHDHAPTYQFEFVIFGTGDMNGNENALWQDEAAKPSALSPWMDHFSSRGKIDFVNQQRVPVSKPSKENGKNSKSLLETIKDIFKEVGKDLLEGAGEE